METSKLISPEIKQTIKDSIPDSRSRKMIGIWLITIAGITTFGLWMGGLNRLLHSGLPIVEWSMIIPEKNPWFLSNNEWEEEFNKFKPFPQHQSQHFTLEEYKNSYKLSYLHRMGGRGLGLMFFIPAAYFWITGKFNTSMKLRMSLIGSLFLLQGYVGWWMIKSGLYPEESTKKHFIGMSQYRIFTHLTLSSLIFSITLWTGLGQLIKPENHNNVAKICTFRSLALASFISIFITTCYGAFVSGTHSGDIYQNWPKFGDYWLPEHAFDQKPWWRNFFENQANIQSTHRHLAYLTIILTTTTWFIGHGRVMNKRASIALTGLAVMGLAQVFVGVLTLWTGVPLPLASLHEFGSMPLMGFAIWLLREIKKLPNIRMKTM